jgi:hypothetical protein
MKSFLSLTMICCAAAGQVASAQAASSQSSKDAVVYPTANAQQTETDEYTRYELLAPETASFKIYYEVTATTAGAKYFYNPIRKGSVATDESVTDAMTGKPLVFAVVSGEEARKDPLMPKADLEGDFIKVTLARPVPEHGQGRVIIIKTYKDPKSYFTDDKGIVFNRPLGIRRNRVVLPPGYEITGLTVPSQIVTEKDGRVGISFMHVGSGEAPLVIHAKKDAQTGEAAVPHPFTNARSWEPQSPRGSERSRLGERAHSPGDRDIVYFLQQPETNSFSLYHDYTESKVGINGYANIVREGSKASNPSAYNLDTGEQYPVKDMSGAEVTAAGLNLGGEKFDPKAEVVIIPFTAIKQGETMRLRITETYKAPDSYKLDGDELIFDRSLGRPRNAVVLPSGWYATASATPTTVSSLPDGRVKLDFWSDWPEGSDVLLKAKRRVEAK